MLENLGLLWWLEPAKHLEQEVLYDRLWLMTIISKLSSLRSQVLLKLCNDSQLAALPFCFVLTRGNHCLACGDRVCTPETGRWAQWLLQPSEATEELKITTQTLDYKINVLLPVVFACNLHLLQNTTVIRAWAFALAVEACFVWREQFNRELNASLPVF